MDDELFGWHEHEQFELGAEDMERRARRLEAEVDADMDAIMGEELPEPDGGADFVCCECSHRFTREEAEGDDDDPTCPSCGSSDLDVA